MSDPTETQTSWTRRQIARVTRNSLIAHGISLTCIVLIVWLSSTYLQFFFRGPSRPSDPELLAIIDARGGRSLIAYVELRERRLLETGWKEVTTSDGRPYSQIPFYLAPVGDRYLLVLARSADEGRRLIGPIGPIRELEQQVVAATERANPELAGKILPVSMSSVAAFDVWGYVLLAVLIPWTSFTLYRLARAVTGRLQPDLHPLSRQFAALAANETGAAASHERRASLDEELASDLVLSIGPATLTESWLVRPTVFGVRSVRLDQVVWVYPVRQQYESFVVFGLRDGRLVPVSLKDDRVSQVIEFVVRRYPWVLQGHEPDRAKLWKRQPQEIVTLVDARRADATGG